MNENTSLRTNSIPIYGGEPSGHQSFPAAPPIFQTSTFAFESLEEFDRAATSSQSDAFYTRYGNPNAAHAAGIIAQLEGGSSAAVFSSGMGAATTAALTILRAGDHVIAQRNIYTGTAGLLHETLSKFNVTTTFVDQTEPGNFEDALTDRTRLIWLETPSNPLLSLTDLRAVADIAKRAGVLTLCDNTVATPLGQRPIDDGIDIVLHSATKALNGHADVLAGAIVGSVDVVQQVRHTAIVAGATLGPFEAWLLVRGMRTFPLRAEWQSRNALQVAQFLETQQKVLRVHYPGLTSHPQHELALRQMRSFGCLLSFEIDADEDGVRRFLQRLRLVRLAVSLGGYDSLIARVGTVWSIHEPTTSGAAPLGRNMLRLSVGIEDVHDLCEDLSEALTAI